MFRKHLNFDDTLFSLVTGKLPSAVAVLKLAGPNAFRIANKVFYSNISQDQISFERGMRVGKFIDYDGSKIDDVVMLVFPSPHSYSGEDTVEFQCHGSIAIVKAIEKKLSSFGARQAEKGEFSYRAFLNGKLDARALEDLADVFMSRQISDLKRIYSRLDGSLDRLFEHLKNNLIELQAIFDTSIDFSDEYASVLSRVSIPIENCISDCSMTIQRYSSFLHQNEYPRIVIAGGTNAGKSSLFNTLLRSYRSIVHDEPGTTRDVIEEEIEFDGMTFKLVDIAGLRYDAIGPEKIGIDLGKKYLEESVFWILVVDGTSGLNEIDENLLNKYGHLKHIKIWNKRDLFQWKNPPNGFIPVSLVSGDGVLSLLNIIKSELPKSVDLSVLPTQTQVFKLEKVKNELNELKHLIEISVSPEYLAEKNRQILNELDVFMGEVDQEMILDRVFNEFCIGK